MSQIEDGALVRLDYTLSTEELLVDTTEGSQALEFIVGTGTLHPAMEMLLIGLEKGAKFEKWIDANMAFGEYDPQWRIRIARKKLPEKVQHFEEGMSFETLGPDNKKRLFRIVEANDDFVIMDGNHPLAGENLLFEVHVLDVRLPS